MREIRRLVAEAVPRATESFSYKMPGFRRERVFFYFAAFKHHIGIYPPVADLALGVELAPYTNAKGNLRFPLERAIPFPLVVRVAKALDAQYQTS